MGADPGFANLFVHKRGSGGELDPFHDELFLKDLHLIVIHRMVCSPQKLGPQFPGFFRGQCQKIIRLIFVGVLKEIEVPFAGVMDNEHDFLFVCGLKRDLLAHAG